MNLCEIDAEQPATTGHLCRAHADDLHKLVARIPDLLTDLDATATRQSAQVRGVTGGGDGDGAMPFHIGASITRDLLTEQLAYLVRCTGHQPIRMTTLEQTLTALRGLPRIAAQPDIEDIYPALAGTVTQGVRMIDVQGTGIVVGECDCRPSGHRQPLLVAEHSFGSVICPSCDSRWDVPALLEQRADRVEEARGERMPVTTTAKVLAQMGFSVTPKALQHRVDRGQLDNNDGVLLGDAMDVLMAHGKGPTTEGVRR